jgi:hypothetical protein
VGKTIWNVLQVIGYSLGIIGSICTITVYDWSKATPSLERVSMIQYWPLALLGVGIVLIIGSWIDRYLGQRRPKFMLDILSGHIFVPNHVFTPNKGPLWTGIVVDARIRNVSTTESIAIDWELWIKVAGKPSKRAQPIRPPEKLTLTAPIGRPGETVLSASDFQLIEMAHAKPLRKNDAPLQGNLLFHIAIPKSEVSHQNTIFQLKVHDVEGHSFSTKLKIKNIELV